MNSGWTVDTVENHEYDHDGALARATWTTAPCMSRHLSDENARDIGMDIPVMSGHERS